MILSRWFSLVLVFLLSTSVYGQEVLSGFTDSTLPVLNEELRKLKSGQLKVDDVTIEKSSGALQLKLAPVANGGLGADFSSATAGTILFFSSTGTVGSLSVGSEDGELLTISNGSPKWLPYTDINQSNVIYHYQAALEQAAGSNASGEIQGTSLTETGATNYRYLVDHEPNSSTEKDQLKSRWRKVDGIDSVTILAQVWGNSTGASQTMKIKVTIGTESITISGSANTTSPEWVQDTLDVSGLTDGTVYAVTVSSLGDNFSGGQKGYIGTVVMLGG